MITSTNARSLIKANMPVVCSDNGLLSVVEHLEGTDVIKLAKDIYGQHHYIPLGWVDRVDDQVHLDRTGVEAVMAWSKTAAPAQPDAPPDTVPHHVNSVDATIGQPIVDRVKARQRELEAALAALPADHVRARVDLEVALSAIGELLTGDLTHVPPVVVTSMNLWLENNKHLAESAVDPADAAIDPAPAANHPPGPFANPFYSTSHLPPLAR